MEMLDKATEKYFDEKFGNIDRRFDGIEADNGKTNETVGTLTLDVNELKTFKIGHIAHHEQKEKKKDKSIALWVMLAMYTLDKIQPFLQGLLPPSP